jgi:predicted dehydrogenase
MKRRDFLYRSSMAGTAMLIPRDFYRWNKSAAEKITVAVIGLNGRGEYLATLFANIPDANVAYLCDVDSAVLERASAKVAGITGKKPKGFSDLRKLLELKELDAVAIATPDHWHAPAALMAVKSGKHVYVEKPCSHNPAEGEMLVQAASTYQRLIQMGNQRRSWPGVMEAIQVLKEGAIGRPYFAKGWYANARKSIGVGQVVPVPANLDFELWQGPAPRRPYKNNIVHYNWHWFWNWGTGEALNNGTHEIDVMRWGLGVEHPGKVVSAGGRYQFQDDWETPDTQTISFEFPDRKTIAWEGRSCNDFSEQASGRGVIFYGDKGTLVIPGGDEYKIYDMGNKLVKETKSPLGNVSATDPRGMGEKLDSLHLINFLESVRGKAKLNSPIAEGFKSTLLPQLGNMAFRTGGLLVVDPKSGRPESKEGLALWSREYEKGWEMKL